MSENIVDTLPEIDSNINSAMANLSARYQLPKPMSFYNGKFYCGATQLFVGMSLDDAPWNSTGVAKEVVEIEIADPDGTDEASDAPEGGDPLADLGIGE